VNRSIKEKEAMKLKLMVVDLELSKRAKRIAAAVLVPVLVVAGGAVAYADMLHVWNQGDTLNANDLNSNFADLNGRVSTLETKEAAITSWTAYSPAVTASGTMLMVKPEGVSTSTGYWRRVGDMIEVSIGTVIASCGSASGQVHWSLPPGVLMDQTKTPYTIGEGLIWDSTMSPVEVEAQGPDFVTLDKVPGPAGGLYCSQVSNNTTVRFHFTAPVQGWTVSN
jgi:hypothetical protein